MISSAWYAIAVQIAAVLAVFCLGLLGNGPFGGLAIILGVATNIALKLPESGPGLCAGMIAYPLFFVLVAGVGRFIRKFLMGCGIIADPDERPNGPTCAHCGYCIAGLLTNICPECGEPFENKRISEPRP